MGLLDFFRREKRSGAVTLEQFFGGNTALTVEIAMQVPAVARCVGLVADAAAMIPVKLYVRKEGGEIEEIKDDPRLRFLNGDTGDTMNADNMRRMWVRDYLLTGSAFSYIESYYGKPAKIKYIPSNVVSVMRTDLDYIHKRYTYSVNGMEIYPYQMLKLLRNSDGFGKGKGIVEESPLIMETMYQLLRFQKNQALKGGNKRGFFKSEKPLDIASQNDIKNKWRDLNSVEMSTDSVMLLNGNIEFKEMSSTSVEMQLNENFKTNDMEIMRLFGTMDGILSDDTVKNAVIPVLDAFEAAFDSDLLLESEKKDHYFAFDTKELTRGDISKRYSAYATALQNNFMQLDEVRALEDLPPLGFNYITLGLQNVLVNPSTGEVYTPNTNAVANMNRLGNVSGKSSETDLTDNENRSIIEDRSWVTLNGRHLFLRDKGFSGGGGGSNALSKGQKALKEAIDTGKVSTKVNKKKQAAHKKGTPQFLERRAKGEFPGYTELSYMEIQSIINSNIGNGKVINSGSQFKVNIKTKDDFGYYDSKKLINPVKTNCGTIHLSKDGAHLIPSMPDNMKAAKFKD